MDVSQESIAYILLSSQCKKNREVRKGLEQLAQESSKDSKVTIKEMYEAFGIYDFILKLEGVDFYNIGQFVVEKIRTIPGVTRSNTYVGFDAFKVLK